MPVEVSFGIIPLAKRGDAWHVFLIHQINGDFWGFPKGHLEVGETEKGCAERELREETGLEIIEYLSFDPLTSNYLFEKNGETIDKRVTLFPAITTENPTLQAEELHSGNWCTLEEAHTQISYAEGKSLIAQLKQILR